MPFCGTKVKPTPGLVHPAKNIRLTYKRSSPGPDKTQNTTFHGELPWHRLHGHGQLSRPRLRLWPQLAVVRDDSLTFRGPLTDDMNELSITSKSMATPPDVALNRLGQIKGDAATWGPGAAGVDKDRALLLKLGSAEVLDAFMTACLFKGKTRERNIRGGKSVAFPITGKMAARYHKPGTPILGEGNDPSDLNERVITLDALMIADAAIYQMDELMTYFDVRQIYTTELGRALAYEYDKRVARMIYAAANTAVEPLNKDGSAKPKGPADNTGRVGKMITLGTGYTAAGATRQAKGDALVDAIFDARIALEKKDVSIDGMYAIFTPSAITTPSPRQAVRSTPTSTVAVATARSLRARLLA